ncbi:mandelate racemase/muconate lactonizing enzyme family protein [Bordetella genomosp. 2]|uniref:Mandelate racemase n=1 Tax=Bordetella genomosp. 2 TaxID=1983456 RepID=A0A261W1V0_9BORD|nr:mandelate racemase/muconate lactonizing enzyme family protein [Bordetella genomosp. 2]OZI79987.1 mandelate racemase [Bordetella genomosp. 2]
MPAEPLVIERLEAFVFRAPAEPPVQTSFGIMKSRPAVLVSVTDADGCFGWGEIWCNFPIVGAEHRARLALAYCRPLVEGRAWPGPAACWRALQAQLAVLALQTGEQGPLQQVMAGVDTAMWDLAARRAGVPLWQLLGGPAEAPPVAVYASGINPTRPAELAAAKRAEGYRAFKLKVGFGAGRDLANLRAMREAIGQDVALMVDANQAWDEQEAAQAGRRMADFGLLWLEEPMRADVPLSRWAALAQAQPLRLAGGENYASLVQYQNAIARPGLAVLQPDVGKWGGITGCLEVGRAAVAAGKWYCPHWLGAGIGLRASMHLKIAAGGAGYVEVDANPNPLRDLLAEPSFAVRDGLVRLPAAPGLGVAPNLQACRPYAVAVATAEV